MKARSTLKRLGLLGSLLPVLLLSACGGGSTDPAPNVVPISVNNFNSIIFNRPYVTVTVCDAKGINCTAIPNVIIDTGSTGLRLWASAMPDTLAHLDPVTTDSGAAIATCQTFANNYVWGAMRRATVGLGGLATTLAIPIQVINDPSVPAAPAADCASAGTPDQPMFDPTSNWAANGILGVGNQLNDCQEGSCPAAVNKYFVCATSAAASCHSVDASASTINAGTIAAIGQQVLNPIAALPRGFNNGVLISLPAVSFPGALSVTGSMVLGIGSSNARLSPDAQILALSKDGELNITINGAAVVGMLDSGTSIQTLPSLSSDVPLDCTSTRGAGLLCPPDPISLSLQLSSGYGVSGSRNASVVIANADTQFSGDFAALPQLGLSDDAMVSNSGVLLGFPFFYGRTIAFGIAGLSGDSAPYGFEAF